MPGNTSSGLEPVLSTDEVVLDSPATASRIIAAREASKVSQKALAIEMGISQPYLSDLEHGNRKWSMELFLKAKDALVRLTA